jgi:hypothetical protein
MKKFYCKTLSLSITVILFLHSLVPIIAQTTEVFSTPGTFNWVVPACVTSVTVEAWGGGGGGGAVWSRFNSVSGTGSNCESGDEICAGAGGGGGGGYASRTYTVVPGNVYTIVVGNGGAGGTASAVVNGANPGSAGGFSRFSGPATAGPGALTANGGAGGGAGNIERSCNFGCSFNHNGVNGAGGIGGTGLNGTTNFTGGTGATGSHSASSNDRSGGGGGAAGPTGAGGTATGVTTGGSGNSPGGNGANGISQPSCNGSMCGANGNPGIIFGGAGGGAVSHNRNSCNSSGNNHTFRIGGAGARGEVRIRYTLVTAGAVRGLPTGQQCAGTILNFSSIPTPANPSYTFSWGADTNSDGTSDISGGANAFSFTAVNNGTATIQNPVTVTVSLGGQVCATQTFTPSINPIPAVNDPGDQNLCSGENASVLFSGNGVANTSFNWNNDNTTVGLAGSGSGNISFTTQNVGTATVTVTPVATNGAFPSCIGSPQIFVLDVETCILPVEWLFFTGTRSGKTNELSWTTASENNCSHYEIQYSKDAVDFKTVGTVNSLSGGGNYTGELNYYYTHNTFDSPVDYYRLKQVDFDGNFSFSNVIAIEGTNESSDIILYPNPVEDMLYIIVTPEMIGKPYEISNALGQIVGSGILDESKMSFSTINLSIGVYHLLIDGRKICKPFTVK